MAAVAGLSTLGIVFAYGVETTAGQKPTSFARLHRINAIGGFSVENETIDASALEDYVSRYIRGRGDTGGTMPVTVNLTAQTREQWKKVIQDYADLDTESGLRMWFQTIVPDYGALYIVAQPPTAIPFPSMDQNELLTAEMTLTIDEYVDSDNEVVVPTDEYPDDATVTAGTGGNP